MGSSSDNAEGLKLQYNLLGHSGVKVSELCLGTSTFGSQQHEGGRPSSDDATAFALMDRFVQAGGNYINTADMYSHGESESIVGTWLQGQKRDELVITGKAGSHINKSDPNDLGSSRKHLVSSLEKTLSNLQSDYLDVYNMHRWDPATPVDRLVRTLNDFVRAGKIRYFGLSNHSGAQLQKIVDYCHFMGLDGPVVMESEWSLLSRGVEYEVTEVCKQEGVSFTPWGALKGGWLSGKITRENNTAPSNSRIAWSTHDRKNVSITSPTIEDFNNENFFCLLDLLQKIGKSHGKTVAQVAVQWLLRKDIVPSVVIGAKSLTQLDDTLGAAIGWSLTQEEMNELDEASMFQPVPDCYFVVRRATTMR